MVAIEQQQQEQQQQQQEQQGQQDSSSVATDLIQNTEQNVNIDNNNTINNTNISNTNTKNNNNNNNSNNRDNNNTAEKPKQAVSKFVDDIQKSNNNDNNNNKNNNSNKNDKVKIMSTPTSGTTVKNNKIGTTGTSIDDVSNSENKIKTPINKSAVSQRNVDIKIAKTKSHNQKDIHDLTNKVLKLDLAGQHKEHDEYTLKSPKSPISARLAHQSSLTSSVDVEDRKTLREALYQGIFHRHRRTIFAVGSFLRMLRSRNSQYNTIRSSSEGEDIDEIR